MTDALVKLETERNTAQAKLRVCERTSREWRSKALMRANRINELEAEVANLKAIMRGDGGTTEVSLDG